MIPQEATVGQRMNWNKRKNRDRETSQETIVIIQARGDQAQTVDRVSRTEEKEKLKGYLKRRPDRLDIVMGKRNKSGQEAP